MSDDPSDFFAELKRRRVFRTAAYYAVAAGGVWGAAEVAVDALSLPPGVLTFVVAASLAGFPFALILAWYFDLQIKREGSKEVQEASRTVPISRAIAVGLSVAIVGFIGLATSMALRNDADPVLPDPPSFERRQITFLGSALAPAVSPDGRYVAFRAKFGHSGEEDPLSDSLMVMVPGEAEPRGLLGLTATPRFGGAAPRLLHWSRDGSEIWYLDFRMGFVNVSSWKAISLEGGAPREIHEGDLGAAPNRSGSHSAVPRSVDGQVGATILDLITGESRTLSLDGVAGVPHQLEWSPDDRRLALLIPDRNMTSWVLWSLELEGERRQHLLASWAGSCLGGMQWGAGGRALYYDRGGRLWKVQMDPENGSPLREDGEFTGHDLSGAFSVSADGSVIVLEQRQGGTNLWKYPLRNDSLQFPGLQLTRGVFRQVGGRISPDGSQVAFSTFEDEALNRGRGISLVSSDGGSPRTITTVPAVDLAWSPDGEEIAFLAEREGVYRAFVVSRTGGNQRLVGEAESGPFRGIDWCRTGEVVYPTADGRNLVILDAESGSERLLWEEGQEPGPVLRPICSPDGQEAAVFGLAGELGLLVVDLRDGTHRRVADGELAVPHTWPVTDWIFSQTVRFPAVGGEAREIQIPVDRFPDGLAFVEVSRGVSWALVALGETEASDLHLIQYRNGGR